MTMSYYYIGRVYSTNHSDKYPDIRYLYNISIATIHQDDALNKMSKKEHAAWFKHHAFKDFMETYNLSKDDCIGDVRIDINTISYREYVKTVNPDDKLFRYIDPKYTSLAGSKPKIDGVKEYYDQIKPDPELAIESSPGYRKGGRKPYKKYVNYDDPDEADTVAEG